MNENCILKNIAIAKKYLEQFNLLLPNDKMCMECCYFPPFSEKTFYVQVFCENNQYKAHCAYTYYADFWGLESYSQTFETVEQADRHNAKVGNVICKVLKLDSQLTNDLIETVKESESVYNEVCIDGISAFIRIFPENKKLFLLNTIDNNVILDKLNVFCKRL